MDVARTPAGNTGVGYDLSVCCSCYREGLTATDPPCPREWVKIAADGVIYNAKPGGLAAATDEEDLAFDAWADQACVHPRMRVFDEYVGQLGTTGHLLRLMRQLGPEAFPHLFPWWGGAGALPAAAARAALDEVRLLREALPSVTYDVHTLVETTSGYETYSAVNDETAQIMWSADGAGARVSRDGFQITQRTPHLATKSPELVFAARRFETREVGWDATPPAPRAVVEYRALDSGQSCTLAFSLPPWGAGPTSGPRRYELRYARRAATEVSPECERHLDLIERGLEAALGVGNPLLLH